MKNPMNSVFLPFLIEKYPPKLSFLGGSGSLQRSEVIKESNDNLPHITVRLNVKDSKLKKREGITPLLSLLKFKKHISDILS